MILEGEGGFCAVFEESCVQRRLFFDEREKNKKSRHPLKIVEQMEQTEHSFVIKDLPCTSLFLHEEGLEQK